MSDPSLPAESKHFKAIAAMSRNRVIGVQNRIPWHFPEDFKWFRKMTLGRVAVMGRKTFESLGKPLPNRINLVLTRHPQKLRREHPELFGQAKEWRGGKTPHPGGTVPQSQYQLALSKVLPGDGPPVRIIKSLEQLNPNEFETDIFICGGAEIYAQTLPRCSDLYLTVVHREYSGDAFFPEFEDLFKPVREIMSTPEFTIVHYQHRNLSPGGTL